MTLLAGIAGYGVVGTRRRECIDRNPRMRTVAVCDQRFDGSGTFEDGVRYHRTYNALLEEPLDVLFVSLPNHLAPEVTIAGLERGLHVFCEKPPGRDVEDVERVMKVERGCRGLVLKYGFNHRYHESVREALRLVNTGELGELVNLRGVYGKSKIVPFEGGWRSERRYAGGGILLDQGIHMVDLMRLFCGDFTDVKSYVSNGYWKHDVEDNAYAIMRDDRGRVAMLHSSATQWQHRFRLDIALTEGYIELHGILSGTKSYGEETLVVGRRSESDVGTDRTEVVRYLDDPSWQAEIDEFAAAVLDGSPLVSGSSRDALGSMRLVYRIYCEDEAWRSVYGLRCP